MPNGVITPVSKPLAPACILHTLPSKRYAPSPPPLRKRWYFQHPEAPSSRISGVRESPSTLQIATAGLKSSLTLRAGRREDESSSKALWIPLAGTSYCFPSSQSASLKI